MAARKSELNKAVREIEDMGWQVERTKRGHLKCTRPDAARTVIVAAGSGDWRAWQNATHELDRSLRDGQTTVVEKEDDMAKAFAWSYSTLKNFETCPKRHYHYDVLKDIKEPDSPILQEGHAVHTALQYRVSKGVELPPMLARLEPLVAHIVDSPGTAYTEQKLALTSTFQPSEYFGPAVWFRTVLDLTKVRDDGVATVLDYKTGKVTEDMTQLQLMSVTLMAHMPKVMEVRAALVFVNHGHVEPETFTRRDITPIWAEILPRVRTLERARAQQEFPPQPSGLCRKYCGVVSCPYHGRGG